MSTYDTGEPNMWCPGCGNFGIRTALINALEDLKIPPHKLVISSGIGQAPKLPHYVKCNGLDGIHGRSLPEALGAYVVNPRLTYIAVDGDGGAYAEGTNHFIHAIRRNPNMLYLVHDNKVFGLTKGQASPVSRPDFETKTSHGGTHMPELNPMGMAIANNGTFIARGYSGDGEHLTNLIKQGIQHNGLAYIDILQPCVSYNHVQTYQFYKERVYHIEDLEDYNPRDRCWALEKTFEWGDKIPIGIFFKSERPAFHEQFKILAKEPLTKLNVDKSKILELLDEFH